jgi:ribosomal protein S18 acetylase RimI-like enzyme
LIQLRARDRQRLVTFLKLDVESNIFLFSVLHRTRHHSPALSVDGNFYGAPAEGPFRAIAYVTRTGLCVPFAPVPDDAYGLAIHLRRHYQPRLLVGPIEAVDRMWAGLRQTNKPRLLRTHRLYSLRESDLLVDGHPDVRSALPRDLEMACEYAALMQLEELGLDPRLVDDARFRRRMATLISRGQHYVLPAGDVFGFQASAGSVCDEGAQVEAVYTPPRLRGRGFATAGLAGMARALLTQHPCVTLHVNEENIRAIKVYDRVGFKAGRSFRLISA